jgi:thiosulfate/3-mercaptopyruvate sulfurtransferase
MNAGVTLPALVSAEALHHASGEPGLRIVDARFVLADPGAGERAWRGAAIPGAAYAHLDHDLSGQARPASDGRHPLPAIADFRAALGRLGIAPGHRVVAYDAADGSMAAARLWWLLRLLGHARVQVLDGGLARWNALGLPTVPGQCAKACGDYPGEFDAGLIAGTDEVSARLGEAPGWLVDARAAERYRGEVEPIDRVAGHIPGAINRPYTENLEGGLFKDAERLRGEFAAILRGRDAAGLLLQCGSGVTACHHALALAHAGLPMGRIYAASWSGWISDPARPVRTGAEP